MVGNEHPRVCFCSLFRWDDGPKRHGIDPQVSSQYISIYSFSCFSLFSAEDSVQAINEVFPFLFCCVYVVHAAEIIERRCPSRA